MRPFASVITMLMFALAALAPAQAADWQPFEPAGGGFQIEFPGKPTLKSEDRRGRKIDTALYAIDKSVAGADLVFMVKYEARSGDPGPDAPATLEAVVKAMASGNKLIADAADEIDGFPAREFTIQDADKDTYHVRVVITDRYFVQAMFLGPADNALGKQFLESFSVGK